MATMRTAVLTALAAATCQVGVARAALIGYQQGAVAGGTPPITFSEVPLYTLDPAYSIGGGPFAGLQMDFGSYFTGQTLGSGYPVTLQAPTAPGVAPSIVYDYSGYAITYDDAASPSNPVLAGASGYPYPTNFFAMPLAIAFSSPVPAVGLTLGSLGALGATTIEAYDANGNSLGSIVNDWTGFEPLALTDPGGPGISAISIFTDSLDGLFEIDNVFVAQSIAAPEPASLLLLAVGLAGLAAGRRRRLAFWR